MTTAEEYYSHPPACNNKEGGQRSGKRKKQPKCKRVVGQKWKHKLFTLTVKSVDYYFALRYQLKTPNVIETFTVLMRDHGNDGGNVLWPLLQTLLARDRWTKLRKSFSFEPKRCATRFFTRSMRKLRG